ncbi:MAG: acyltransferase, partial [Oxalobacteraceae bacterium]
MMSENAGIAMHYRKDIQVLRGLAVLFVVMFHLQAPGFHAGFIGVDIFFVISGYLMGVMYDPERKREFFVKRAARLLPAYFATILVTLFVAAMVVRPDDFSKIADQAIFGSFFASNIGYWMADSYFDKSSFKPLLHLWSLSVEIQFYLLVPIVSASCRKYRSVLWLLAVVSAILCFLAVTVAPGTAFYLLPFRLWEFLAGFAVAMWLLSSHMDTSSRCQTQAANKRCSMLGCAL